MSFDVMVVASTASPKGAAYDQQIVTGLRAAGATSVSTDGGESPDGVSFESFGGDGQSVMFSLRSMSPGVCRVIFQAAKQTNSYVAPIGDGDYVLEIKGTPGRYPDRGEHVTVVATPEEFCKPMMQAYGLWAGYAGYVQRHVNPSR